MGRYRAAENVCSHAGSGAGSFVPANKFLISIANAATIRKTKTLSTTNPVIDVSRYQNTCCVGKLQSVCKPYPPAWRASRLPIAKHLIAGGANQRPVD